MTMFVHVTASEILPRLWIGTDFSCAWARKLGLATLCVLEKPCENEGCEHIPITRKTPLGIVLAAPSGEVDKAVWWLTSHWPRLFVFDGDDERSIPGVLVHCAAGMERSPLVTALFLEEYFRISLDEAYEWIRKHRPIVQDRRAWLTDNDPGA
jgi:dual specificity protein phosphatase-like protein